MLDVSPRTPLGSGALHRASWSASARPSSWCTACTTPTAARISLFTFACRPGSAGPRQAYLAQLLAPSLHAAWVRTQLQQRAETRRPTRPRGGSVLTVRELDILKWIYLGKSNFEIGAILKISPLTVKNHVQKILRKLNVVNRTQAIGKSLELRILNP